jgi:hypothetical protein
MLARVLVPVLARLSPAKPQSCLQHPTPQGRVLGSLFFHPIVYQFQGAHFGHLSNLSFSFPSNPLSSTLPCPFPGQQTNQRPFAATPGKRDKSLEHLSSSTCFSLPSAARIQSKIPPWPNYPNPVSDRCDENRSASAKKRTATVGPLYPSFSHQFPSLVRRQQSCPPHPTTLFSDPRRPHNGPVNPSKQRLTKNISKRAIYNSQSASRTARPGFATGTPPVLFGRVAAHFEL